MGGPYIVVVAVHRSEPVLLGQLVVAALLETERVHPAHEAVVGMGLIDERQRASDAVTQVGCVAEEEVELVADEQTEQVGGPADEQLVEEASGAVPIARGPRLEDDAVGGFSVVECEGFELLGELAGAVQVDRIGRGERHVGGQDVTHGEVGFLVDERRHRVEELVAIGDEVVDGCVVASDFGR